MGRVAGGELRGASAQTGPVALSPSSQAEPCERCGPRLLSAPPSRLRQPPSPLAAAERGARTRPGGTRPEHAPRRPAPRGRCGRGAAGARQPRCCPPPPLPRRPGLRAGRAGGRGRCARSERPLRRRARRRRGRRGGGGRQRGAPGARGRAEALGGLGGGRGAAALPGGAAAGPNRRLRGHGPGGTAAPLCHRLPAADGSRFLLLCAALGLRGSCFLPWNQPGPAAPLSLVTLLSNNFHVQFHFSSSSEISKPSARRIVHMKTNYTKSIFNHSAAS